MDECPSQWESAFYTSFGFGWDYSCLARPRRAQVLPHPNGVRATILEARGDPKLFGSSFAEPYWRPWLSTTEVRWGCSTPSATRAYSRTRSATRAGARGASQGVGVASCDQRSAGSESQTFTFSALRLERTPTDPLPLSVVGDTLVLPLTTYQQWKHGNLCAEKDAASRLDSAAYRCHAGSGGSRRRRGRPG